MSTKYEINISTIWNIFKVEIWFPPGGKLISKPRWGEGWKEGGIFFLISLGWIKRLGRQLTFYSVFSGRGKYAGCYGTFVPTKLGVHKTVTMGVNLHQLIYNLLIGMVFSLHILLAVDSKMYQLRICSTQKGLFTLLNISKWAEDWSMWKTAITKIIRNIHSWIWFYTLIKFNLLQVIMAKIRRKTGFHTSWTSFHAWGCFQRQI